MWLVLRDQTVFICDGGRKGREQFTGTTSLNNNNHCWKKVSVSKT